MPLQGYRVLDLTRLLPGPYCTMLLADFGSEVIKVEDEKHGDYARRYEPKLDENSAIFHSLNRNKKSVCLDLKSTEGKEAFLKLVEISDVVVESFRPGVMERLGLDYETLKEVNPGLVYCAITGYGQTGPYASDPGHDINYLSRSGLLDVMGEKDGKPTIPATQIADIGGGAYPAAVGILIALLEREKTGEGQFVDISMLDGVISWLQTLLPGYLASNVLPKRGEEMLNGGLACYEVYETKDARWLAVGALEPKFWKNFCEKIDREEFIPLLHAPLREQHMLKYEIQKVISTKYMMEWEDIFADTEACVTPVLTLEEVVRDPHVLARKIVQQASLDSINHIDNPIKLSRTPGKHRTCAPKLGEHSDNVLRELGRIKK
ncbi:CoA transferase [Aquibacillus sp. 3ASR75-11]|uniref:CoA transferase n=1 Tax=Terrihalobacillus insolitus TaxID=2950438 RepID=A0A9X4AKT4_9BACI|nr:CaiB/BaiF CoA-transferase family protein [Terrihalobacillus insolitus]MDC3411875.1 CoA transferase [Terrihalobacillus insolitus]MDC3423446.1 CoA transferase [Terrihalobacillus insolitus]